MNEEKKKGFKRLKSKKSQSREPDKKKDLKISGLPKKK